MPRSLDLTPYPCQAHSGHPGLGLLGLGALACLTKSHGILGNWHTCFVHQCCVVMLLTPSPCWLLEASSDSQKEASPKISTLSPVRSRGSTGLRVPCCFLDRTKARGEA